jgi:two-component system, NarL family, sensor histidine kinase DegS
MRNLSQRYQLELGNRLSGAALQSSHRAEGLGKEAIAEGLETLDLAHIHRRALLALMPSDCSHVVRARTVERAGAFFLDVLLPIEKTRSAVLEGVAQLKRSNEELQLRTIALSSANRHLKAEVAQRKVAERALKAREEGNRRLLAEAREMQNRLRHLSHQVLLAQEKERKEISRELHDEIVQTLTGINVQLATLKLEAGANKKSFSRHLSYTQRLVEKSVNIVHQFARNLRPTLLDDLGLTPALVAYIKAFTKRTGLRVAFSTFSEVDKLSNDLRTVFYRVALAALVNIAQHAKAKVVNVKIERVPGGVVMEIKDDGISFDAARVLESRKNKRLGLIGMRERVEMVGGTFKIDSAPGLGTTISALLPSKQFAKP